jgi:hypothetical protein
MKIQITALSILLAFVSVAQLNENVNTNKFKQLKEELATPNVYRTASGAPGHEYYQQKADYVMNIQLDDEKQRIDGEETITYTNNSPDPLDYLWVQLDQNVRAKDSQTKDVSSKKMEEFEETGDIVSFQNKFEFDGGFKIKSVKTSGKDLKHFVNYTMMRIDLPQTLKPGGKFTFSIEWWYNINNRMEIGGRSGYEHFKKENNYIYTIAQFFPRMAVYNDVEGWQNKQFLGRGEFALAFGDYDVSITVPSDHIVASTGELANASQVLTGEQKVRLDKAKNADQPMFIVTPEEAKRAEKSKSTNSKTWRYKAKNVRDFAFASSRKFIWDAQGVKQTNSTVLAMSYYPKEGNPLWERYSTRLVAQTLKTYSKYTFDYPYPVAISVHSKWIGMEYPMICFNGGRPEADGTYSESTKYGMHGVIIHEVGHNYFPMIINSDERQWTWMDEGLNTFLQYLTEQEWQRGYPSRRGPASKIAPYMAGDKKYISPIMTNSESIWQFGNNAYGKPATALNILRETVMGRELFDYAFKTYAQRWMFKHPTPADFFRTMEDASGVDLDWFWRGWFYTTDHVDISLNNVKYFQLNTGNPETEKALARKNKKDEPVFIGDERNNKEIKQTEDEKYPKLKDFYTTRDEFKVDNLDRENYQDLKDRLTKEELALLNSGKHFYQMDFENKGGLVMPIILEFSFEDGTSEKKHIPAQIWQKDNFNVSKVFIFKKKLVGVKLDPNLETADTDFSNNSWPHQAQPSRFQLFQEREYMGNPMQRDKEYGK